MKRITVFVISLLIFCFFVRSQNKNGYLNFQPWYNEAESLYESENPTAYTDEKAISLYKKTADYLNEVNTHPQLQVDCLKKIADIYLGSDDYVNAILFYNKVLFANASTGLKDSVYDYQANLYLGSAHYHSNSIDSARYYFEEASAYANHIAHLPDLSFLYNSLGVLYYESANYMQAKNYFEQAYPDDDSLEHKDPQTYVSISNNIATCLKFLGYRQEALWLYHKLLPLNVANEKIYYNIGNTHLLLKHYDSAIFYFGKLAAADNITTVRKLNDIGLINTEKGDWLQAENVFDSAIALNRQTIAMSKNKELAYSYFYKALLAEKQGLTDEAIGWCNNAMQVLHFDFKWKNPADLPDDETKVISPIIFFEVLHQKAKLLEIKYKEQGNQLAHESALATYMKAIKVASFIKSSFDNDEAGYFFKENYKQIYDDAIEVAYELININAAAKDNFLQIMESYKGSILYHNIKKLELKDGGKIPASIIHKEKGLKQSLAAYTTMLNNTIEKEKITDIQKKINETEVAIWGLQRSYEQYPEFEIYKRQSDANNITVSTISKKIDAQTAVISFLHTPGYIYGLAITGKEYIVHRTTLNSALEDSVAVLLNALYEHTEGRRYEGYNASAYIYNRLIAPFLPAVEEKKRWIVLPDGMLNFMPFNALQPVASERKYIAEDKIISNHYSILLLLSDSRDIQQNIGMPVIFAPFAQQDQNITYPELPVLMSSAEEARSFNGDSFISDKATKSKFLSTAGKASLIHLATHATSDIDSTNNACIYFYPSGADHLNARLYAHEIYNMELPQTKLVILSACETAKGKNSIGEGLMSLARAFIYAGSDGVISTFWKTEDKISAYIMQRLHYYLQQNKTPEEALHYAKKDFLNNEAFDAHFKTPNYWANFIYIGDLTPLHAPRFTATNIIALLVFAGMLILGIIIITKKIYLTHQS